MKAFVLFVSFFVLFAACDQGAEIEGSMPFGSGDFLQIVSSDRCGACDGGLCVVSASHPEMIPYCLWDAVGELLPQTPMRLIPGCTCGPLGQCVTAADGSGLEACFNRVGSGFIRPQDECAGDAGCDFGSLCMIPEYNLSAGTQCVRPAHDLLKNGIISVTCPGVCELTVQSPDSLEFLSSPHGLLAEFLFSGEISFEAIESAHIAVMIFSKVPNTPVAVTIESEALLLMENPDLVFYHDKMPEVDTSFQGNDYFIGLTVIPVFGNEEE